jgi:phosphopantetheinyl transferase
LCSGFCPETSGGIVAGKITGNFHNMPIFFQHVIDADTRVGIWKIEEPESFFLSNVPLQQEVHHPHKRLQHLAGRFLLRYLAPAFPYDLIRIADTKKPFLENDEYHFSISHCGDYAAAIVSQTKRVGVDIEIPSQKVERIKDKFLNPEELGLLALNSELRTQNSELRTQNSELTLFWSCKEAVFKWYGLGQVDFRMHIQLKTQHHSIETVDCSFTKTQQDLLIHYKLFDQLVLAWVVT